MDYRISNEDLEGDPEYMVAIVPSASGSDYYPEEDKIIYIPERIMWRILGISETYNLQFSAHVSPNRCDRWVYRYVEVEWLLEELEFIRRLLNDEVLTDNVQRIEKIASKALSNPNKLELAFEGP